MSGVASRAIAAMPQGRNGRQGCRRGGAALHALSAELTLPLTDLASFRAPACGRGARKSLTDDSAIRASRERVNALLASAGARAARPAWSGSTVRPQALVTSATAPATLRTRFGVDRSPGADLDGFSWIASSSRSTAVVTLATIMHQSSGATQPRPADLAVELWQAEVRHISAVDRADHRPDRATGSCRGRRAGRGRGQAGQPDFEPHADIIVKGSRDVRHTRHKLNLTTGRSGLILDLVVEAGNPADSERLLPMLEPDRAHGRASAAADAASPRAKYHDRGRAATCVLPQETRLSGHEPVCRKLRNCSALGDRGCTSQAGHQARLRLMASTLHLARAQPLRGLRLDPRWSAYNLALFERLKTRLSRPPRVPPTRSHGAGAITHASTSLKPILHASQQPTTCAEAPNAPQYAQYAGHHQSSLIPCILRCRLIGEWLRAAQP